MRMERGGELEGGLTAALAQAARAEPNEVNELLADNWDLYFPFDEFSADLAWCNAARLFRAFLSGANANVLGDGRPLLRGVDIERATEVVFDYQAWLGCVCDNGDLGEFASVLRGNAAMTLQCLGLALCSLRRRRAHANLDPDEDGNRTDTRNRQNTINVSDGLAPLSNRISARFVKYRPLTSIRMLRSNMLGKFVALRGTVVRVSGLQPLVKRMEFSCSKCEEVITKSMQDGLFQSPTHCETEGCKGKTFRALKPSTVAVDYQRVRLQDVDKGGSNGSGFGAVPRTLDVELSEELVEQLKPGDFTTVTGVVKAISSESLAGRGKRAKGKNKESSLLVLVLEANAIETKSVIASDRGSSSSGDSNASQARRAKIGIDDDDNDSGSCISVKNDNTLGPQEVMMAVGARTALNDVRGVLKGTTQRARNDIVANLTEADYRMIMAVATQFDFAYLVHSLCPLILGHERVKAGLLLGLAGGSSVACDARNSVHIRGDAHVLVVGDPGLGKSQMLKAAAAVSPRGVYVCGNTASKSGLTVSLSKDATDGFSLEAGALVLADCGVCCIDEFDKMTCDQAALLEAMEQQSISIAKAGTCCTLSARTTILAAANPIGGHYNRNKTILENLHMSSPLLSRFDLVFILVDAPSQIDDDHIADYVMDMHLQGSNDNTNKRRKTNGGNKARAMPWKRQRRPDETLNKFLRSRCAKMKNMETLPPEMLRKYLAFAKHYVHPKLTAAAAHELQAFYLELRQKGDMCDSTPITTRQLESLVRLAQARAKLELRDLVTKEDAADVISLMREALTDAFTDMTGVVDMSRAGGMSTARVGKALIAQLKRTARERGDPQFTMEQIKFEARQIDVLRHVEDFRELVDVLNQQCYLLKKGPQLFRLPGINFD